MKKVTATEFKANCSRLIEQVHTTRKPLLITKRGRPVVKLVATAEGQDDFIGCLEGVIRIVGDIESPVVPLEAWETLR